MLRLNLWVYQSISHRQKRRTDSNPAHFPEQSRGFPKHSLNVIAKSMDSWNQQK